MYVYTYIVYYIYICFTRFHRHSSIPQLEANEATRLVDGQRGDMFDRDLAYSVFAGGFLRFLFQEAKRKAQG